MGTENQLVASLNLLTDVVKSINPVSVPSPKYLTALIIILLRISFIFMKDSAWSRMAMIMFLGCKFYRIISMDSINVL